MNLYFSGSSSNIAFILKSSVCISSDELHKSCESLIKDFLCLKGMHNLSLFCGRSIKCNLFIISVNMSCVSAFVDRQNGLFVKTKLYFLYILNQKLLMKKNILNNLSNRVCC